jgi:hypothetical protein
MREVQPALFQFGTELGKRRRGNEQHERRRHDVVHKPRRGDFLGADAAADAVVALDHQDLVSLAAELSRRHQRVDPASDDDVVGRRHCRLPGWLFGFCSLP